MIQSSLLSELDWLVHGFGTKNDELDQSQMASLRQIHSARVLQAESIGSAGEGDALVTRRPGLQVSVRTADCLPVLLADPVHRVVSAVHAGWRGTAAQIVPAALKQMSTQFGTEPRKVVAAIGPGIGKCCYHVGEEVGLLFGLDGAGKIDLVQANFKQLVDAGIPDRQIEPMRRCTFCEAEMFYSFRREKEQAGRMISYIGVPARN